MLAVSPSGAGSKELKSKEQKAPVARPLQLSNRIRRLMLGIPDTPKPLVPLSDYTGKWTANSRLRRTGLLGHGITSGSMKG
jgi:hypothetical protein